MRIAIHQDEFNLLLEYGAAASLEAKRLSEKYGKDYFDCEDIVKIMGIGKNNARELFRDNSFPAKQIGNRRVISAIAFTLWGCALSNSTLLK